jgi:hypothetical protein
MYMTSVCRWTIGALLFLTTSAPLLAQFETATVVGTARDTTGAVVPGTTITLTNTATGVAATRTTGPEGSYEFFTVKAGMYIITAEKTGFSLALVDNVQVEVGARLRVDLQMPLGQVTEKVEVTATTPLLETESSQRGQVIGGTQVVALPLNGREYSSLALLTTGVRASDLNRGGTGTNREGAFNVNGLRSMFNNFLIDGVDNNAYGTSNQGFSNQVMQPPPDAVSEFKVVTNNESAEYGRAAGATINVAYKSGGNSFKGSAWEFNRNTGLNATGFFAPPGGQKPTLDRNQYGGVLGGPIVRSRAFFFADFEGFRQTRSQFLASTIATTAERAGIFPVAVRDPSTGITYNAGTPIPMTAFASRVMAALPEPTNGNAANNYSIFQQFTNHTDKAGGKIDLVLSPTMSAFGRYGWRDLATNDQPPLPLPAGGAGNGQIYARNKQLALGATFTPGTTSLLEVRFAWSSTEGGKNPPGLGTTSALDAFGLSGLPSDPRIAGGLPTQLITSFSDLGRQATNPQWQYPTVWNPKVNYTRLAARHSIKTGYEFQGIATEVQDVNPLYGRDTYAGQFTRPAGVTSNNLYNLSDFMLGLRSQYALSSVLVAHLRQDMHFLYVQDDFAMNNRLTLNLGLRYEYATPIWERDNILTNFDPATRTMVTAKDGSISDRALVDPDRNNFGPRLGFAFTPREKTVIRGGYGVGYVHYNRAGGGNLLPINGPQVVNAVVNQTNPLDPAFVPTQSGYPAGLADPRQFNPLTANITYMPRDIQDGRVQNWYLSVQREIGPRMLVDVAYVGNRADNLLLFANINQAAPNNAAGTLSLQSRRPISTFSDITYAFDGGRSEYRALQLKYDWRMKADVSLLNAFTWSRAMDNGAASLENANGNFPAPQDFNNLGAEWSTSGYDQPFNNTTSLVFGLPFGRGRMFAGGVSAPVDAIIGGWRLAGVNTVTSGVPVTFVYSSAALAVVSGIAQDFRGANNYRPNVVCDPTIDNPTITAYFNTACVVAPTDLSQPFGNAPRNSVQGPIFWQLDASLTKQIVFGKTANVEVRLEAFNVLNRTNFFAPSGNRSTGAFGTITGTYDARQLQFGVKVNW